MNIILATALYPPEIAEPAPYVRELARRLAGPHRVTVVAYAIADDAIPGVTIVAVDKRRALLRRLFAFTAALYRAARGADVILVQHAAAASLPAIAVGRLRRIPVVVRVFEDEAWQRARARRPDLELVAFLAAPENGRKLRLLASLQGWVLRSARLVIAPTRWFGGRIAARYRIPAGRWQTVRDADPRPVILPFTAERNAHLVAAIAPRTDTADTGTLIRAAAQLRAAFPAFRLLIAGDDRRDDGLAALVSSLGLGSTVEFLGPVSSAEVWHLRRTAAVVVHHHDGPEAAEAVALSRLAGATVVALDSEAYRELVPGAGGHLVERGDPSALAERIGTILRDPGRASRPEPAFGRDDHAAALIAALAALTRPNI